MYEWRKWQGAKDGNGKKWKWGWQEMKEECLHDSDRKNQEKWEKINKAKVDNT